VVEIVRALSNFFRTTLSKGKDWITIGEEIELTKNYLTIQKMRYQDILNYKIEVDEAVLDEKILKLTLQPLVENALYHGIKPKEAVEPLPYGPNKTTTIRYYLKWRMMALAARRIDWVKSRKRLIVTVMR